MADDKIISMSESKFVGGLAQLLAYNELYRNLSSHQIGQLFNIEIEPVPREKKSRCLWRFSSNGETRYDDDVGRLCGRSVTDGYLCGRWHSEKARNNIRNPLPAQDPYPGDGHCVYPTVWVLEDYNVSYRHRPVLQNGLCGKDIEKGELFCEECTSSENFTQRSKLFLTETGFVAVQHK